MTLPHAGDLALVAVGTAAGALARWAAVPQDTTTAPWVTLGVNVVGCFLLSVLPAVPAVRRSRRAALVLGPGVLGGFTTVSAWAGQVTGLAGGGEHALAGLLLVTTLAGALAAAHLGRRWARRWQPQDMQR